ncbi:OmpW/AlkL family protein [Zwartia panacis]|uniref:OmpW/AlkL family protein n=1 Tax=Zwartia panacis TaxID=2683345 RepID=UPI0025B4B29B|nr:OmpW family outer membrane protein [Zwartia panacis]MDN4017397.1 OmpW family outer membrane protein [Zwartia panacis]
MCKKVFAAALVSVGMLSVASVQAQTADPGSFMVRARAVYLGFENGQSGGLPIGGNTKVTAQSLWIPEVDFTYFFTKNIAAELVLTYPQDININVGGTKAGTISALPPSLLLQYHFTDMGAFKPYVGVGLNYTIFTKRDNILDGAAKVSSSSVGAVGQVGFDYMLDKNWGLNVDLKYIQMSTKVYVQGDKVGTVNLNPLSVGMGVSYRF